MAITSNFPNVRPTLLLDFANTKQLDPRITFTRASTASYYDGRTVAKAEQNLLLGSQTIGGTGWSNTSSGTATQNSTTAPDGTTTAATIGTTAATASFGFYQSYTYVADVYTLSVYAKAGTYNFLTVDFNNSGNQGATFNLSTGAIGFTDTNVTSSIVSVGNGWYRCIISKTMTAGTGYPEVYLSSSGTVNGRSFTAAGTENIYAWGAQLEQRSSVTAYTATTTAAITNYIPALQTAASGVARFDHNPTTDESLGLLIEESRTNLLTYSEQLNNAAWTKTNSSVTANIIVAPDGTLTADKLVEDTTLNNHDVRQSVTTTAADHSFSVYLKASERQFVLLWNATANFGRVFNLSTGTVSGTVTGVTQATASISSIGNGWYRCTITGTCTAANNNFRVYAMTDATTFSYTGDGYSGVYIWGAQLEAGAFATSYIPTVASTVTRAADAASMTGTNFSSWYAADQGTMYVEYDRLNAVSASTYGYPYVFSIYASASGASNNISFQGRVSQGEYLDVNANGTTQARIAALGATLAANTFGKVIATYKVNDFATSGNAGTVATDTSGLVPATMNTVVFGNSYAGSEPSNGHIRKFAYYPTRVTNVQLQGLTS